MDIKSKITRTEPRAQIVVDIIKISYKNDTNKCSIGHVHFKFADLSSRMQELLVVCVALAAAVQASPQQYTARYDNINVNDILKNERLLASYIKCALEITRCSPEGKELKG